MGCKKYRSLDVILREKVSFDALNEDMDAFNVNFLDTISDRAIDHEGDVDHGLELSAVFTQQPYDLHALRFGDFNCLNNVGRIP